MATIGTCSICGGRVTIPDAWMSTVPPVPQCEGCGARKRNPHGRIIDMVPAPARDDDKTELLALLDRAASAGGAGQ